MRQTFEATIDEHGNVQLLESIHVPKKCRALLTVLDPVLDSSTTSHRNDSEFATNRNGAKNGLTRADINEPTILIRINRTYRPGMTLGELYDATRRAWRVGKRRDGVKFAFAIFDSKVLEVYRIDRWRPRATEPGRFEFEGAVAEGDIRKSFVNRSVDDCREA